MHRIFNKLKWVNAKDPEMTRKHIQSWLPQKYWADVNLLWVGFGQELQQEREKLFVKAVECSRPYDALQLMRCCGVDYIRIARKLEMYEQVEEIREERAKETVYWPQSKDIPKGGLQALPAKRNQRNFARKQRKILKNWESK